MSRSGSFQRAKGSSEEICVLFRDCFAWGRGQLRFPPSFSHLNYVNPAIPAKATTVLRGLYQADTWKPGGSPQSPLVPSPMTRSTASCISFSISTPNENARLSAKKRPYPRAHPPHDVRFRDPRSPLAKSVRMSNTQTCSGGHGTCACGHTCMTGFLIVFSTQFYCSLPRFAHLAGPALAEGALRYSQLRFMKKRIATTAITTSTAISMTFTSVMLSTSGKNLGLLAMWAFAGMEYSRYDLRSRELYARPRSLSTQLTRRAGSPFAPNCRTAGVGNPLFQCKKWRDRTIAQNVAKPRRIRPRMELTRRKKIGPMRGG
jgi:hypothetical protein